MRSSLPLALATCLVLCSMAQAELGSLESIVSADQELNEMYGNVCTSVNGIDFNSLPTPKTSLQERIGLAEDNSTIYLDEGLHKVSTPIDITKNITAIGEGLVVIDAERSCEILNISDPNLKVIIENIIFVNGKGDNGGAIDCNAKKLTLKNCTFINNMANEGGSISSEGTELAVFNGSFIKNAAVNSTISSSQGKLRLENVTFEGNLAIDDSVTINYVAPSLSETLSKYENDNSFTTLSAKRSENDFDLVIKNCTFENNTAFRSNVGEVNVCIIYVSGKSLIKDSNFDSNTMDYGSAPIFGNGCPLIISNCRISNNQITEVGRSCGVTLTQGEALLENCEISGNKLPTDTMKNPFVYDTLWGGGIYVHMGAKMTLNNSTISHNIGGNGGGIYNRGTLVIHGGEISSNSAPALFLNNSRYWGYGGGIFNKGNATLDNVRLLDNFAQKGGAIYNEGAMCLKGCSIARNTPDDVYNP